MAGLLVVGHQGYKNVDDDQSDSDSNSDDGTTAAFTLGPNWQAGISTAATTDVGSTDNAAGVDFAVVKTARAVAPEWNDDETQKNTQAVTVAANATGAQFDIPMVRP